MPFYFRKSFGSSAFKINFSKSGISYSAGIKGARVNFSNKGTYVNFGRNGIYYRKKISSPAQQATDDTPPISYTPTAYEQHTITSNNIEEITDADSQDFINELIEKSNMISYYHWFGIFPLILTLILFFAIFFSTEEPKSHLVSEPKDFIKSTSSLNTNIRTKPNKSAIILGSLNAGEQFELLDESNKNWYKIKFKEQEGYVSKKFSEKITTTSSHEEFMPINNVNLADKDPILFWISLVGLSVVFGILLFFLKRADKKRLLIEIYYNIDESINGVYQKFVYHFSELLDCSRVWQYLHSQRTNDYKYSSGAGHTITRRRLTRIATNKTPSKIFLTNVKIPYLGLINTELFFFPERLIIKRKHQYGAIMYKNIQCQSEITRFIESEGVPGDAIVVDHTWRYLNKNGTPDKRFKNNYQLPICQYSEYSFNSSSGLNERIATSKLRGFDEFIRYVSTIGQLQKHMPTATDENIVSTQKRLD